MWAYRPIGGKTRTSRCGNRCLQEGSVQLPHVGIGLRSPAAAAVERHSRRRVIWPQVRPALCQASSNTVQARQRAPATHARSPSRPAVPANVFRTLTYAWLPYTGVMTSTSVRMPPRHPCWALALLALLLVVQLRAGAYACRGISPFPHALCVQTFKVYFSKDGPARPVRTVCATCIAAWVTVHTADPAGRWP